MDRRGVQAVGQGKTNGRDCIVVYVSDPDGATVRDLPSEFQGVPVEVRSSGGPFQAQSPTAP